MNKSRLLLWVGAGWILTVVIRRLSQPSSAGVGAEAELAISIIEREIEKFSPGG